ncbi:hypothetical protein AA16373_1390 [Komagataeibacter swingsii DSM 16373]|nr:hypothetical protein AA16373_1390 [Komagataeibacter swingsii DSM 16373]
MPVFRNDNLFTFNDTAYASRLAGMRSRSGDGGFIQSSHSGPGVSVRLSLPAPVLAPSGGFRIMNTQAVSTPKPRKEPHEEWREALIHAWKNRRGYARAHEAAHVRSDDGFAREEA